MKHQKSHRGPSEAKEPDEVPRFVHKKSLGQNFLNSPVVPGWMCDAADLVTGETVLEIGPGTGALTRELLARGVKVVAVEADRRAIESLQATFATEIANNQLNLRHGDARTLDVTALGLEDHTFKVVANIPYYLTGLLFRTVLESNTQPSTLVFLIQKEVAERIARSEKESILSISVKAFGTPAYVRPVTRGHFTPPPAIDSAILAVRNISRKSFEYADMAIFFNVVKLGFGQKRKQLLGNLSKAYPRERVVTALTDLHLPLDVRAEDVPLDKWLALTSALAATDAESKH